MLHATRQYEFVRAPSARMAARRRSARFVTWDRVHTRCAPGRLPLFASTHTSARERPKAPQSRERGRAGRLVRTTGQRSAPGETPLAGSRRWAAVRDSGVMDSVARAPPRSASRPMPPAPRRPAARGRPARPPRPAPPAPAARHRRRTASAAAATAGLRNPRHEAKRGAAQIFPDPRLNGTCLNSREPCTWHIAPLQRTP